MSELTDAGREARREYMREWRKKHKEYMREWQRNHKESVRKKQNKYWNKVGAQMEAEEGRRVPTMLIEARDYCLPHAPVKGKARGRLITNLATSLQLLGLIDSAIKAGVPIAARRLCENYGKDFGDEEVENIMDKVLREVEKGDLLERIKEWEE